jgi:SAM-dependent methyltransferase
MSYYSAATPRLLRASYVSLPAAALAPDQMSPSLDDLSIRFAAFTRTAKCDALDIGCGDGIATAAALTRGGHVMAVDPDQGALHQLLARVPPEQYRRLKVRIGRLPGLDFKFARFSAIHAARVLHLLEPEARQQSLRKFFRWLYPSGKLFISTPISSDEAVAVSLVDEPTLRCEIEAAGFVVEHANCYPLPWHADRLCCAVIARCGP